MISLIAHGGIGAFPSALGTLLFLSAILMPFLRSFDRFSLVISILFSLLAFYTKPYFLLGFGIVLSYLFLFVSKKKGFFFGISFLAIFFLFALLVDRFFPMYFINTMVSNVSNTYLSRAHLFSQLKSLLIFFYPALAVMATLFLIDIYKKGIHWNILYFLDFSRSNAPLIGFSLNYLFYSFLCSLLAFIFILGPHIGTNLNYAYQLVIPIFFCWSFYELNIQPKAKMLFGLILLFNLFVWEKQILNPEMLKQKNSEEWAQVFDYIHASEVVLNSPAVTSELVVLGQMPMDSGQTSYYYLVKPFSENMFTNVPYDKFYSDGVLYVNLIDRMIEKQRFDLLILTKEKVTFFHSKNLSDYYEQVDEIQIDMPQTGQHWTLVIWKPLIK